MLRELALRGLALRELCELARRELELDVVRREAELEARRPRV